MSSSPFMGLHRRIAHLDMDAFYASVELLRYPQLKGLPIVIGGSRRNEAELFKRLDEWLPERNWTKEYLNFIPIEFFQKLSQYSGRGVITTATYPARAFGIGSAMGLMKAGKLCPHAILLPVDFKQYEHYSNLFKSVISEIAPCIEDRGIDEVYIDFTHVPGGQRESGRVLARLIQKTIFDRTGLTCSIGVGPNKLLAKMASEFNKPNGISIVNEQDIERLIWPLECRKINGIGPKSEKKLHSLGITTIRSLAAAKLEILKTHFGLKTGSWLFDVAHGEDNREVVTLNEPVSLSRETTLYRDMHAIDDKVVLGNIFTSLCTQVAEDLQRKGYEGRKIGIKLRFNDFKIITRDKTLGRFTSNPEEIRQVAGLCLKRAPLNQRLRLLGIRVSSLRKISLTSPKIH